MRAIGLVGVAVILGCGGDTTTPADGGTDGVAGDAPMDVTNADATDTSAPMCDPTKPFGAPVEVTELNKGPQNLVARLTHDELTVYFEEYGLGPSAIYVATRTSMSMPFGAPKLLTGIVSSSNNFDPTISGDDLTIYFASERTGGAGGADLWFATRPDTSSMFGTVTNLMVLDTAANEHAPYAMPDGLTLYYTGGVSSIMRATRTSTSAPFTIDNSGVLNAVNVAGEVDPVLTLDELTLFYASDDANTSGSLYVQRATRATTSAPFGAGAPVAELAMTGHNVSPSWISDDTCRLYLDSDVSGAYKIYVATKPN